MKVTCKAVQAWLALSSVGNVEAPPEDPAAYMAHLAGCSSCKELACRYDALAIHLKAAFSHEVDAEAEERFVSTAAARDAFAGLRGALFTELRGALDRVESSPSEGAFLIAARQRHDMASSGAAQHTALVDALRPTAAHDVSTEAEAGFMEAARNQRETRGATASIRTAYRKAALAAAAVACVTVATWLIWSQVTSPQAISPPPGGTAAATGGQVRGTIVSHSGTVLVNGEPIEPYRPAIAKKGTYIEAGEASRFRIRDKGGAVIIVNGKARVEIIAWSSRSTRLLLRSGTIRARVTRRAAGELFEIRTPNARATVVGTEFSVTYLEQGTTIVNGISGTVRVEREDGRLAGLVRVGTTVRVEKVHKVTQRGTSVQGAASTSDVAIDQPGPMARDVAKPRPAPRVRKRRGARRVAVVLPAPDKASSQPGSLPKPQPPARVARPPSLLRARTLLAGGKDQAAIALLQKMPPGDWRRDALLGDAHQLTSRYDLAARAYRDALARSATPPAPLLADLAKIQATRLKQPRDAARSWRSYLKFHPRGLDAAHAHLSIARFELKAGRSKVAEWHFSTILKVFPRASETTAAVTLLGAQFLKTGRWSAAEALFKPYVGTAKCKEEEVALVGMIRVRIALGNTDAARRLISHYRKWFQGGRREHEVQRLEDALENR